MKPAYQISFANHLSRSTDVKSNFLGTEIRPGAYPQIASAFLDIRLDPLGNRAFDAQLFDVGQVSSAGDDEECASGFPGLRVESLRCDWLDSVVGEQEEGEGQECMREGERGDTWARVD